MKKFLCFIALLGIMSVFQCCTSDDSLGIDGGKATNLRLSKLDIVGSKALAIVEAGGTRSSDNQMLFKMDEDGNLSAVYVEVIELEDGTQKSSHIDYTIQASALFGIGDRYIYMTGCMLQDAKGNYRDIRRDYEGGDFSYYSGGFCMLVNKMNGKIYYVPQIVKDYFPRDLDMNNVGYENDIVVAEDGTFYMHTTSGVVKVEVNGDNASVSTFGPQDGERYEYAGGGLIPLENGPVIWIIPYSGGWSTSNQLIRILYQNGGFETFDGSNDEWHRGFGGIKDEYTCCYDNGRILAVRRPASNFKSYWDYRTQYDYSKRYESEDVELSIVEIRIGDTYGNIEIGQPLFSLTGQNEVWQDYSRPEAQDWTEYARDMGGEQSLYVLGDYFMIGNVLAINRNTLSYRDLVKEGISEHVIIPTTTNVYNGKAWTVYSYAAMWFDPADMTYGEVTWDCPNNIKSCEIDIPNGNLMIVYLNPVDGSKHLRTINIETGDYVDTDVPTTQNIFQLIPIN